MQFDYGVSKQCIILSSNLVRVMVTTLHVVLILVNLGLIVFFYRDTKENSYTLQPLESNYDKHAIVQQCFRLSSN